MYRNYTDAILICFKNKTSCLALVEYAPVYYKEIVKLPTAPLTPPTAAASPTPPPRSATRTQNAFNLKIYPAPHFH